MDKYMPEQSMTSQYDDNVDLRELFAVLWTGRIKIVAITAIFAIVSLIYALSVPNQYKATALLSSADSSGGGLSGALGQLGGLASLAGVSLGGGNNSDGKVAIKIMQSWSFIEGFIDNNNLEVGLSATYGWDKATNKLLINTATYDPKSEKWLSDGGMPSSWELYQAFLGRLSLVFYKEIGFSKTDIALYSKGIGWLTTVLFTLLGGLFAVRMGLVKAMFVSGIFMACTNILFSVLAWVGTSEILFAFTVLIDDLSAAFATVAFVGFISALVDRTYTATQYALLASIGTAGRTLFASSSGMMVDWLNGNWIVFFIITALMVIPSLICLFLIRKKLKLNEQF